MFGKSFALLFCATLAAAQHIEYGARTRFGAVALAPAPDSKGNLVVLTWDLAFGIGPAPNSRVLILGRYGRDGSSQFVTDTGLNSGSQTEAALLAVDQRDRIYVGVNRQGVPVLGRFGSGNSRESVELFDPFTKLVAIRFAPNGDPIVLGSYSADITSTIQLVQLDSETLAPKARRLFTGVRAAARALALDRNGAVYVAGTAFTTDLAVGVPVAKIGSADLGGALVIRLSPDLAQVESATIIGGRVSAGAAAIEIAGDGSVYLAGNTLGGGENLFPTSPEAFQTKTPLGRSQWASRGTVTGPSTAFVARLSADGAALLASTLLAGSVSEHIDGLVLDEGGNVVVHGFTNSVDFPATGVFRTQCGPDRGRAYEAAFVTQLDPELRTVERSVTMAGAISSGLPRAMVQGSIFMVIDQGLATVHLDRDEEIDVACVVSGASYRKLNYVVPGQLVTLFGRNIGPEQLRIFETGEALPGSVDGIEVSINGVAAPVLAGVSRQLNVVAPSSAGSGDFRIEVHRHGKRVFFRPLPRGGLNPEAMLQVTPEGRTVASPEDEYAQLADVRNEDGTLNGPDNPAAVGSEVTAYASGLGELNAPIPDSGYGDGLTRPVENFAIDTSVGRLAKAETFSLPGRTKAVMAVKFRIPETGGMVLRFKVQTSASPSSANSGALPNFLYVRQ